jgi:AAA domain (dynein-related subfamily)
MEANGKYFRRKATFPQLCSKCGANILVRQYFTWIRTKEQKGTAWHYNCQHPYDRPMDNDLGRPDPAPKPAPIEAPLVDEFDPKPLPDSGELPSGTKWEVIEQPKDLEPAPTPQPTNGDGWLAGLAREILPFIDGKIEAKSSQDYEKLRELFESYKSELEARVTHRIEVHKPNGEIKKAEGVHFLFPKLMYLVSIRQWAYLHGPAGGFKSTSARLAAEMNDLDFDAIPLNMFTLPNVLFGFMDANGAYVSTGFRRCYEHGGVFLIDELDNGTGNLLTALNAALENGYCSFPDRLVKMHPNFVCVATGNTSGRGANRNHAERRALDAATLDRFKHVEWSYDWPLVNSATLAINPDAGEWVKWVRKVSEYCQRELPHVLATPRACFSGAQLLLDGSPFTVEEIAEMCIFKGIDKASRDRIVTANPYPSDPRSN